MKKILVNIFILVFCMFFLCGCNQKPFIVFSSSTVTSQSRPESVFLTGKKIYYAAVAPDGFEENLIKIQIFKQDEKSEFWGYSYMTNKTVEIKNNKFYRDYVVFHQMGHYIMQVFYLSNLQKPLMMADFWVR
jgi:hypothetical protein